MKIAVFYSSFEEEHRPFEQLIEEGKRDLQEGEKASTFEEQKLLFNKALNAFLRAVNQSNDENGDLNRVIGDIFYQLDEFSWAILYYNRALKYDVPFSLIEPYLEKAQVELGLSSRFGPKKNLFTLFFTSTRRPLKALFWVLFLFFILSSLYIWFPLRRLKLCVFSLTLAGAFLLVNVLIAYYLMPLEGITILPSGFYRDPNESGLQISPRPLLAGNKMQVLESSNRGEWLKVMDDEGLIGYVQASHIRII